MKYRLFLICPTVEVSGVKTHILNLSRLQLNNCDTIQVLYPSNKTNIALGQIGINYSVRSTISNWITTFHFTRNSRDRSIIHLHGRLSILAFLPSIIMRQGIFVYTFHQFFNLRKSTIEKIKDKLEIYLAKKASGRIAVSSALAEKIYADYGIRCVTISNWLPGMEYNKPRRKTRSKDERVFMFAGRYSEEKNPLLLIRAAKKLSLKGYPNKTRFFGHGSLEKDMLRYIKNNKIENTVSLNGTSSEITKEMQSADCIIIPSLSESFGLVYLEAVTNNMSAIVANIPGLDEVTSETNVIRFKSDNVSALVDAMITYLEKSDKSIEAEIEEDLSILAQKYGSDKAELSYNDFYESLSNLTKKARNES